MLKCKSTADDFSYWNLKNTVDADRAQNIDGDDDENAIALSVSLLLKNKNFSRLQSIRTPCHALNSSSCLCQRSFHLYCSEYFSTNSCLSIENENPFDMINIHPAPRNRERDYRRAILISTPLRHHHRHRQYDDNDRATVITAESEPYRTNPDPLTESQLFEKKLRVRYQTPSRTRSLNTPLSVQSLPLQRPASKSTVKYSPRSSVFPPAKYSTSFAQLQIRSLSLFDPKSSTTIPSPLSPRVPPPSPKTPTHDLSIPSSTPFSIMPSPIHSIVIIPRVKSHIILGAQERERPAKSAKTSSYEDHAREYLSVSDCSESDADADENENAISKPQTPPRTRLLSRNGSVNREVPAMNAAMIKDRIAFATNPNRCLSVAEFYSSSADVYKNISENARRRLRTQSRISLPLNEIGETPNNTTKIIPTTKSLFGFSKTASSMHFGHAAGRLGLRQSFEKWPQPLSRRTPMERQQAVTTLRLATLPLVTS